LSLSRLVTIATEEKESTHSFGFSVYTGTKYMAHLSRPRVGWEAERLAHYLLSRLHVGPTRAMNVIDE
jgi:hypothetical protein